MRVQMMDYQLLIIFELMSKLIVLYFLLEWPPGTFYNASNNVIGLTLHSTLTAATFI